VGIANTNRRLSESNEEVIAQGHKLTQLRKQMDKEKLALPRKKWNEGEMEVYVLHMNKSGGTTLGEFFHRSTRSVLPKIE